MPQGDELLDRHIGRWMAKIHMTQLDAIDRAMAGYGLSRATFGFLVHLYFEDGQRQDQICREIKVNKSTIARAVQKLESLGYVVRQPDESDRRAVRVFLTAKAEKIREEILAILWGQSERMLQGISKKRTAELFELLQRVYQNIVDYRNELHEME